MDRRSRVEIERTWIVTLLDCAEEVRLDRRARDIDMDTPKEYITLMPRRSVDKLLDHIDAIRPILSIAPEDIEGHLKGDIS